MRGRDAVENEGSQWKQISTVYKQAYSNHILGFKTYLLFDAFHDCRAVNATLCRRRRRLLDKDKI